MSRFFSEKFSRLIPYVPGEQPRDMQYIKLNTNECPFPPSEKAEKAAAEAALKMNLYSDPECTLLVEKAAGVFGLKKENIIFTNGSDEILNFAFMAYCDDKTPAAFADITYGFYKVFADLYNIPTQIIPLKDDFTIDVNDYIGIGKTIFIANPNAPTGIMLTVEEIEKIVSSNPDNIVVIDEAYIDFAGGGSCLELIGKYENLLVTQTFSKSRSMAGARLGMGFGSEKLISDMRTIKYSTNPYNINMMTMAAGYGALCDEEYTRKNCAVIAQTREETAEELKRLGFEVTPSKSNFIFAKHEKLDGEKLYLDLKARGILVRHFSSGRLSQYNRITVGTKEQMTKLLEEIGKILRENQ